MNPPPLQLPQAWLTRLNALLAEHVPGTQVSAYGSRVGPGSHPGSDLDLVVRSAEDGPLPNQQLMALREALRESDLPILVDVHDWATLPPAFRQEITHKHHPLK